MFNKHILNVLAKLLAIMTALGAVIYFIAGFFAASGQSTAEKVGYFIGYEVGGLSIFVFVYLIIGTLARWNEKN